MSAAAAPSSRVPWRTVLVDVLDAWRHIGAAQLVGTLFLGLAASLPRAVALLNNSGATGGWPELAQATAGTLIAAGCVLLAVVIADRAVDGGARRTRAYVAAVLAGAIAGALLNWVWVFVIADIPGSPASALAGKMKVNPTVKYTLLCNTFLEWLIIGGLATFVYADRRETRRIQAHLHAAQVLQSIQRRQVLESQLQAMQARVEPQFLFNTLARIKDLYDVSATLGEQMLEDLIVYLRAAMPRMRDSASTLAQEIELARAYLNILRIRLHDRLAFAADVPDDISGARFPPMMLLPLLDHAIVHGEASDRGAGTLRIAARAASGRLHVVIGDSGAGFGKDAGSGIASIRDRLAALYGADASLMFREDSGGATEAMMDIPYVAGQES